MLAKSPFGGHAVTPHYSQVNLPLGHQAGGHVVRDQGGGDVVGYQLVGRQAGSLEERSGLITVNHIYFTSFMGRADDTQCRAVAAGGQDDRVGDEGLELAGGHVAGDDATRLTFVDDEFDHLVA